MLISFLHSLPRSALLFPLSLSLAATSPYGVCNSRLTDRMHFSRAPSALYNYIYECAHQIEWLTHLHNATWLSLPFSHPPSSPSPYRRLHCSSFPHWQQLLTISNCEWKSEEEGSGRGIRIQMGASGRRGSMKNQLQMTRSTCAFYLF